MLIQALVAPGPPARRLSGRPSRFIRFQNWSGRAFQALPRSRLSKAGGSSARVTSFTGLVAPCLTGWCAWCARRAALRCAVLVRAVSSCPRPLSLASLASLHCHKAERPRSVSGAIGRGPRRAGGPEPRSSAEPCSAGNPSPAGAARGRQPQQPEAHMPRPKPMPRPMPLPAWLPRGCRPGGLRPHNVSPTMLI